MAQDGHGEREEARLERRVKEALLARTESAGLDVRVEAYGDTVRLHGIVDTLSQKQAAEAIARTVPGVGDVRNDLTVGAEPGWTAGESARELRGRLAANPVTREVTPQVRRGTVELLGRVPGPGAAEEAERIAAGVAGVREVRSHLEVEAGGEEGQARAAREARRRLERAGMGAERFTVWAEGDTLHVRGLVRAPGEAARIREALAGLAGVRRVEALLPPDPGAGAGGDGTGRYEWTL